MSPGLEGVACAFPKSIMSYVDRREHWWRWSTDQLGFGKCGPGLLRGM